MQDRDAGSIPTLNHAVWSQACEDSYPRLLSYSRWLTKNTDEASGIVHDAVCKILKLAPNPDAIGDKLNYLLKSVHNAWVDWVREKCKVKTISLDDSDNEELQSKLVAPERDFCIKIDNEVYRRALLVELKRLDKREKQVFTLFLCGFTCKEISDRLGANVPLITYELNKVRNKVHQRLIKGKGKTKGSGQR